MLKRIYRYALIVCAALFSLFGFFFVHRLTGDSPKVADMAGLVVSFAMFGVTVFVGLLEDLERKLVKLLEPKMGYAPQASAPIEPHPQRPHRYDIEHALVHALAPGLVYRMDGSGVGSFIRQAADAVLGVGGAGCGSLNSRLEAAKSGLETSAQRVGRAWSSMTENVPPDAKVAGSNQSLQAFGSAVGAYEASLTTGDAAGRVAVGSMEPHLSSAGAAADQRAEAEIVAAGLTTAPRVTAAQIQALMDRVVWRYEHEDGSRHTFAHAFLDGDFYITTGHNAPVSLENFDASLGRKYAREQAEGKVRDELWALEGYALAKSLRVLPS